MISFVAKEAATDRLLTPLSLRLLIFLGGENPHIGGWSYHTYATLARHFHVEPSVIKGAQHLLLKQGYLVRLVGTVKRESPVAKTVTKHYFYATETRQECP